MSVSLINDHLYHPLLSFSSRNVKAVNSTIALFPNTLKNSLNVNRFRKLLHMIHLVERRISVLRVTDFFSLFAASRKSGRLVDCQRILQQVQDHPQFDTQVTATPPLKALLYRVPGTIHRPPRVFYISANSHYLTRQFLQRSPRPYVPRCPKYLH